MQFTLAFLAHMYNNIVVNKLTNKLMNILRKGNYDMPAEDELKKAAANVELNIKVKLLERGMTQAELSRLLNINRQQVNRAIKGDKSPRAIEIREKIYRVLDM